MTARARVQVVKVPRGYEQSFLACRDFGHAWEDTNKTVNREALRAARTIGRAKWGRVVECLRCSMERVEWISPEGQCVSRHYKRPQGYTVRGGLPKASARVARLTKKVKA